MTLASHEKPRLIPFVGKGHWISKAGDEKQKEDQMCIITALVITAKEHPGSCQTHFLTVKTNKALYIYM